MNVAHICKHSIIKLNIDVNMFIITLPVRIFQDVSVLMLTEKQSFDLLQKNFGRKNSRSFQRCVVIVLVSACKYLSVIFCVRKIVKSKFVNLLHLVLQKLLLFINWSHIQINSFHLEISPGNYSKNFNWIKTWIESILKEISSKAIEITSNYV